MSNKAILPLLWKMFPGHRNLLPAFYTIDEVQRFQDSSDSSENAADWCVHQPQGPAERLVCPLGSLNLDLGAKGSLYGIKSRANTDLLSVQPFAYHSAESRGSCRNRAVTLNAFGRYSWSCNDLNEFDALAHEELLELERTRHEYNPEGIKAIDRAGALLHGQGSDAASPAARGGLLLMEEVLHAC